MRSSTTRRGWRQTFFAAGEAFFNTLGVALGRGCYRIADWFGERAR